MYGEVAGVVISRGPLGYRTNVYRWAPGNESTKTSKAVGFGNAGMILRDVQASDSDVYRSKVFFKNNKQLPNTTTLTVVEGKSDKR